jgi:Ca2+-binding RTX toxin-like protein
MKDIPASTKSKAAMEGAEGADGFFVEIGSFSGTLEKQGDHDWIRVELSAGSTYHFYLSELDRGSANGSSILYLRDAAGTLITTGSPSPQAPANVAITYTVPAQATYFLEVYTPGGPVTDYTLFATRVAATDVFLNDSANTYTGAAGERILGAKGDDILNVGAGVDALGEQGNDNLTGGANFCRLAGGLGNDTLQAGTGGALMFGDAGKDTIIGSAVFDNIYGGAGKDILTGGGDEDQFHFSTIADSKLGAERDVITDFAHGVDDIDLVPIDSRAGAHGNQKFHWIGGAHFHDRQGELHFVKINNPGTAHDKTIVEGDVNGDGRADFQIELTGLIHLTKGDFVL